MRSELRSTPIANIVGCSLISEGKGKLPSFLPEVLDVTCLLILIAISISKEQVTRVDKTVKGCSCKRYYQQVGSNSTVDQSQIGWVRVPPSQPHLRVLGLLYVLPLLGLPIQRSVCRGAVLWLTSAVVVPPW